MDAWHLRHALFSLLLTSAISSVKGQKCDCALLRAVFHQKEFRDDYKLDWFDGETILIIDSVGYFTGCEDSLNLSISDIRIAPSIAYAKGGSEKQFWIHIHKVVFEKPKVMRVYLWHKNLSNRYGYLRYKKKRNGYVLKDYQLGQF